MIKVRIDLTHKGKRFSFPGAKAHCLPGAGIRVVSPKYVTGKIPHLCL